MQATNQSNLSSIVKKSNPMVTCTDQHISITIDEIADPKSLETIDLGRVHAYGDDVNEWDAYEKTQHATANEPHPALEYPMCYHGLRRFPRFLEWIKVPYLYRWRLSYPFQRKVACSRFLLKLGVRLTWGELLILIPFFLAVFCGIVYTCIYPSVKATGKVARFALIAAFVLAQRNSMVTLLTGMPVDRTLFYHKLAGRLAGVTGLLHTMSFFLDPTFRAVHKDHALGGAFTGQVNTSGTIMMLLIIGIVTSSLPAIRRSLFEVFYLLHFVFVGGLIVGAFFHSGILVPTLALLTWGVDFTIRRILMASAINPNRATLKIISDTVVEVSFPKTMSFAYNPGQYVFLCIPEITWLQWHPFSISSSPYQQVVTLHIRNSGDWTAALHQLASKKSEVDILLEGPYGSMGVDIMGDRKYKSVLLISGGIGITPMQSVCDQLLYEKSIGQRELRNLKFVWIERDPVLVQRADFVKSKEAALAVPYGESNVDSATVGRRLRQASFAGSIASQLMSLVPPGGTTDEELDELYADGGLPADEEIFILDTNNSAVVNASTCAHCPPLQVVSTDLNNHGVATSTTLDLASISDGVVLQEEEKFNLDLQVYLTGDKMPSGSIPFARFGRPDINALFLEMRQNALFSGDRKVAVCVSAPHKLMQLCHRACVLYSDDRVRFDYHSEAMAI